MECKWAEESSLSAEESSLSGKRLTVRSHCAPDLVTCLRTRSLGVKMVRPNSIAGSQMPQNRRSRPALQAQPTRRPRLMARKFESTKAAASGRGGGWERKRLHRCFVSAQPLTHTQHASQIQHRPLLGTWA